MLLPAAAAATGQAYTFKHNDKDRDAGTVAGSDQRRMSSFLTEAVGYLSPLMDVILNAEGRVFIFGQWEIRGRGRGIKGVCSLKRFRMAPCLGGGGGGVETNRAL